MPTKFIPNPLLKTEWENSLEAAAMMAGIGERVEESAVLRAPVATGRLASSIKASASSEAGFGRPEVSVTAEADYAGYVEFGTAYQAAQPYLRPAVDEVLG